MAKFNKSQTNFSAGELDSKSMARIDTEDYFSGAHEIVNFLPLKDGGLTKRPGTQYIETITHPTANVWQLIPFIISDSESYIVGLNLTNTAPSVPGGWAATDPIYIWDSDGTSLGATGISIVGTLPTFSSSLSTNGFRYVQLANVLFITHIDGTFEPIQIYREGVDAFRITVYKSSIAGRPGSDIPNPAKIPYLDTNVSSTTMVPGAQTGNTTLTASSSYFTADMVGSYFRLTDTTPVTGVALVTSYTSATVVNITVITSFGAAWATPTTIWAESAWSDERGWPRTIAMFEQRIFWGGTEFQPDTLWGSRTGNFYFLMQERLAQDSSTDVSGYNYFGTTAVTDPFATTIASKRVSAITWMSAQKTFQVGTLEAEYIVTGNDQIISSSNISIQPHSRHGSRNKEVALIGDSTVYVAKGGQTLNSFKYNRENGSFISNDLNRRAADIVTKLPTTTSWTDNSKAYSGSKSALIDQIYWQEAMNTLWVLTYNPSDTNQNYFWHLFSATIDDDGRVAWAEHLHGAAYTEPAAEFRSFTVIPNAATKWDELWAVVRYKWSSTEYFQLEKMMLPFEHSNYINSFAAPSGFADYDRPWYVDGGARDTNVNTITVPVSLAGTATGDKTLNGLVDGLSTSIDGVLSGTGDTRTFTYDSAISLEAILGYIVKSRVLTLPVEAGPDRDTSVGNQKRVDRTTLTLYKSKGGSVSKSIYVTGSTNEYTNSKIDIEYDSDLDFAYGDTAYSSTNNQPFTGVKNVDFTMSNDEVQQFEISHDEATPFTILGYTVRGISSDA